MTRNHFDRIISLIFAGLHFSPPFCLPKWHFIEMDIVEAYRRTLLAARRCNEPGLSTVAQEAEFAQHYFASWLRLLKSYINFVSFGPGFDVGLVAMYLPEKLTEARASLTSHLSLVASDTIVFNTRGIAMIYRWSACIVAILQAKVSSCHREPVETCETATESMTNFALLSEMMFVASETVGVIFPSLSNRLRRTWKQDHSLMLPRFPTGRAGSLIGAPDDEEKLLQEDSCLVTSLHQSLAASLSDTLRISAQVVDPQSFEGHVEHFLSLQGQLRTTAKDYSSVLPRVDEDASVTMPAAAAGVSPASLRSASFRSLADCLNRLEMNSDRNSARSVLMSRWASIRQVLSFVNDSVYRFCMKFPENVPVFYAAIPFLAEAMFVVERLAMCGEANKGNSDELLHLCRRGLAVARQLVSASLAAQCQRLFDGAEEFYTASSPGNRGGKIAVSPAMFFVMSSVVEPLLQTGSLLLPTPEAESLLCELSTAIARAILDRVADMCIATSNAARPLCREDLLVLREFVQSHNRMAPALCAHFRRELVEQEG